MRSIKYSHREEIAPNILSFWFEKEPNFEYMAGQYIELTFPNEDLSHIGDNRWFTLSSSPTERLLSITTRFNDPLSKFKQDLVELQPGQELNMSEPIGDFVLPKNKLTPLVFISGGIGITPVRSIIKWLTDTREQRIITLYYVVKQESDFIYNELFEKYNMSFVPILTTRLKGESNLYVLSRLKENDPTSMFFVSGPQIMVESLVNDIVKEYGNSKVVMDYFPGYLTL